MAVLIEAVSVVVRRAAVEARYAGGMQAFGKSIPNRAACGDRHLLRVGFMATRDAEAYVESLEAAGLRCRRGAEHADHDGEVIDVAVVSQHRGPWAAISWLKYANIESDGRKLDVCWLAGEEPGDIAVPNGWVYDKSLSADGPGFMPDSAVGDRLRFLRHEGNIDVYLDLQTDRELYTARPTIAGDTAGALNTQLRGFFQDAQAIERQGPVPPAPRWFWQKADPRYRRLNEELLPAVERIADGPGRDLPLAHFTRGVILRLLHRRPDAVQAFLRARRLNPESAGVLRDLVRCLGEDGKPHDALPYAREAASLEPTDPAVLGNLAACLMQCGELAEARTTITRALELDPNDPINKRIHKMLARGGTRSEHD